MKYYNKPIPKSKRILKIEAEQILATKLCRCIKKIDTNFEAKSIGICTKTIFNNLHPYIKKGTLIAFDEWCYNFSESFNDHEQKAFYEYVEQYNVQFEFIDYPVNDVETKLLKIL